MSTYSAIHQQPKGSSLQHGEACVAHQDIRSPDIEAALEVPLTYMSNQDESSRDFAFQTSDQAGGASQHPQPSYSHYNVGSNTSAPGALDALSQAAAQDPSLRYPDFGTQQQHVAHGFNGFAYSPPAPVGWDWSNAIDFAQFTNQYEPQGELMQEAQHQSLSTNDFSTPLPITTAETSYQSFQQIPSTTSTSASIGAQLQTTLVSPPPPPRPTQPRPVLETGMKRKADSEPSSAVSRSDSNAIQNPPKRQNKSRQSSDASNTTPAATASADPHPTITRTTTAPAVTESTSRSTPQDNAHVERRKEPSKGTGPQGRVIDVSQPRKVAESPSSLDMLPAGKVFPIQIGSELFRLSGASISSDGKHIH